MSLLILVETASTTTPTTMLQQQQQQQPPVSALTCHVKIVSFITHLLLLPRGNGGGGGNTTTSSPSTPATIASAAAEATLKLYAESCATYVLQLLRFTSSSSSLMLGGVVSSPKTRDGGASSVDGCTVQQQQQQQQSHVIRVRKELLVNTRQLLSTDYRRGFYRHIDAMLDERVLVGSNVNSRLFGGDGGVVVGSSTGATVTHDGLDTDGDGEYLVARVHGGEDQGGDNTVGSGAAVSCSYASLQPLGYSILAEFVSQVRTKLTPAQLSRTIRIFSRVLHGDLPTSYIYCHGSISTQSMIPTFTTPHSNMQIAAAKLLVHFPEIIFHNRDPNPQVGRDLLFRILRTCVHKLDVVKSWIPTLMNAVENLANDVQLVDKVEMGKKQVDAMLQGEDTSSALFPLTIIQNLQHVIRPIILGMKTLFWCISSYSHQREKEPQRSSLAGEEQFPIPVNYPLMGGSTKFGNNFVNDEVNSGSMKMTIGEREMVEEFIRVGLLCLRIFTVDVHDLLENHLRCDDALYRRRCGYTSSMDVEKRNSNGHREILESFAISFTSLESYNFRKVMAPNLDFMLYQMGIEENNIAMFSHLLLTTGKAVSYEFIEVLMGYLIDNIGGFGEYEREESSNSASVPITNSQASLVTSSVLTKRAQNLFKLLNLCFSSLLKYPRNENAFVPRLQILVRECIQRSMAESPNTRMMNRVGGISENRDLIWPGPYLNTLRALFRTISGGKFDA